MALALLKLSPAAQLASGSRVLGRIEAEAVASIAQLRASADAALAQARSQLAVTSAEQVQLLAAQTERRLQKGALLRLLGVQLEYERAVRQLRERFVDTVMSCLGSMLMPLPPAFFARVQASAAEMIGESSELTLHVAAADEAVARAAFPDPGAAASAFRIDVDPNLEPGQCFLETRFGRVQAGLQTQLEAMREALQRWWSDAAAAAS
jgi:type III secretion protein L